jgi:DNA-binding transcriptional LysR family regulator
MRFTLRQLQVFAAIGQSGNVSQAAERLAMSQSAASTALAELERRSGRPVFDRVGKHLRLNEIGRSLLPKALEMLDRAAEIDVLLSGEGGPGPLSLGATLTIGNYLGPLLIERYWQRHPGSRVSLQVGNTSRIASRVAEFELDLALIEGDYSDPALTLTDWIDDELAVFCGPHHPLAGAGEIPIERALEEIWVVREPGSGTRQTLDRAMSRHWMRWKIGLELEHTEAIKRAVETGRAIGCVSRLALKEAFGRGRLVEIKVTGLVLQRRFYFVLNRRKYRTPGIDAMLAICRELSAGARRADEIEAGPS